MEGVVEDVGGGLDGARKAVCGILVLELDAIGGIVGIGDFAADVGDDDGDGTAISGSMMLVYCERRSWE